MEPGPERRVKPEMTDARAHVAMVFAVAVLASVTACTSDATTTPKDAAQPSWPDGCGMRVMEPIDHFIADHVGYSSRAKALLAEAPGPGYRLVRLNQAAE